MDNLYHDNVIIANFGEMGHLWIYAYQNAVMATHNAIIMDIIIIMDIHNCHELKMSN